MTLHSDATPAKLGIVRFALFSLWFVLVLISPLQQLAELPKELFTPVGPLHLLSQAAIEFLLEPASLIVFKTILAATLLSSALALGNSRLLVISSVILLTFHQALVRGFGHVNHREVPLLLLALILGLFPSGRGTPNPQSAQHSSSADAPFVLQLMTFLFLLSYVSTAAFRIAHCAPEIFLNGTMTRFLGHTALRTDYYGFRLEHLLFASPFLLNLLNIGFIVITIFELLSFLCLTSRRFRIAWLAVMVPFHIFSLLFLLLFFLLLARFEEIAFRFFPRSSLFLPPQPSAASA